jgi:hypothetical protein
MYDMNRCGLRHHVSALLLVAAACGSGDAKYPASSQAVYCTTQVYDCDEQAAAACPRGFKVLHTEQWTSNLGSRGRGSSGAPVRHTELRIACEP